MANLNFINERKGPVTIASQETWFRRVKYGCELVAEWEVFGVWSENTSYHVT